MINGVCIMEDIPNQELILQLLQDYYGDVPNPQEGDYISSHWRHYSSLFEVKLDKQGRLVAISGQGFGNLKWNGFVDRVFDQATIISYLLHLPNKRELLRLYKVANQICADMGLDPTFDVFRQVCSFELFQRHLPVELRQKPLHILMIGDGYGVLSSIFKQVFPKATMVLVDLGKTLLFQAYYCQKAHPEYRHEIVTKIRNLDQVDYVYCPAERLSMLEDHKFDAAVNVTSMQEMNKTTVSRYFTLLRKCLLPQNLFYCCNRESKELIGGEISNFLDYPWEEGDEFLIDGQCPWHRYYFSRFHTKNGFYIFRVRIPFINFYDGKHLHRLAILST